MSNITKIVPNSTKLMSNCTILMPEFIKSYSITSSSRHPVVTPGEMSQEFHRPISEHLPSSFTPSGTAKKNISDLLWFPNEEHAIIDAARFVSMINFDLIILRFFIYVLTNIFFLNLL